jgi:PAS domain S-box-containing protein
MKILIAEDMEDSLIMLEMVITSMGHETVSGANGLEALYLAQADPPDLIISDIMMPEMDGFEFCRQVKADPKLQKIPFIFYTATYTEHQDKELASALGASRFIIKPQEPKVLMAIIKEVLAAFSREELQVVPEPHKEKSEINHMYLQSVGRKLDKKIRELELEREALKASEAKYRHLVESVQNYYFFYSHDTKGVFNYISPSIEIVLGYKPAESLVHYSECLTDNPINKEVARHTELSIKGEEQPPYEIEVEAKDGSLHWLEVKEFPVFDQAGKVTYVEGIAHNITERKRAEVERDKLQTQLTQAQKMEAVGRLAGGVAHDFNNMLGVILGYAELALGEVDSDNPLFDDLQEICKAAERSADLTRQLLAFARKQIIVPKVIDLNETVAGMLKMLGRLIGEDIDLAWLPGADLWSVKVDPAQIDQILANLSVNARDAIAGVGKMSIETGNVVFDDEYCADHVGFIPGEYVLLAVSDDGCGMDKKTQNNLFEPFFTTKVEGHGTGLGLSTVYGIVKQNNGFINVYSEPGEGTTFRVYLTRHAGAAESMPQAGLVKPAAGGHETILLVEDESAILEMTKRILERLGYIVLAASTPDEAIRLVEVYSGKIHLLLSDVVLPEMNGLDLAKKLLAHHSDLKSLFMSGYTANVIARRGILDAGVNFIQKPFTRQGLATKVREVLDR